MTQHEGLPVKGYQPQSEENVALVNRNKEIEETLLRMCDSMKQAPQFDQRWLAIARTHFEEGFMAMNRAVFKPGRVALATDGGEAAELDLRKGQAETFDGRRNDDQSRKIVGKTYDESGKQT